MGGRNERNERKENRAKLGFCWVRRSYVEYSTEKSKRGNEGRKKKRFFSSLIHLGGRRDFHHW